MKLHVHEDRSPTRDPAQVRAMAVAVQANLVQLVVAESKRKGLRPIDHPIRVFSPGHVRHFRETLIDARTIAGYSDAELHLRLREYWGRFCMMRWLFALTEADSPVSFAGLPDDIGMHCQTALAIKQTEVEGFLWKMLFEQRRRFDAGFAGSAEHVAQARLADEIPATANGRPVEELTDDELLLAACEHAGMLATIRWALDKSADWNDPQLMDAESFGRPAGPR